ncbi:MAG TPA: hypothetical protein VFU57_09285 [Candidatus Acidoferrales bacterium]|nr:hypothetical protein [Candidatus Acidoferrales bacterium]
MKTYDRDFRFERSAALLAASALLLSLSFPGNAFADSQKKKAHDKAAQPDAKTLVREMVQNEVKAENDDSTHWRFSRTNVKSGVSKTYDVIETKKGEVQRLISINGHPLNAEQQREEQERMKKFLSDSDEQAKRRESASKDYQKEQDLMKMLPDALLYTYAGRQGDLVKFNFKPNPRFHATTRQAEVFHHMAGILVIDAKRKRLSQFRGRLISGVKFGYGILGYLDGGGTFDVRQKDVADQHWDLTLLETNITGKELFFKSISVCEKITEGNYQRVADDLTLEQAANLLKSGQGRSVSEAEASAANSGRDPQ